MMKILGYSEVPYGALKDLLSKEKLLIRQNEYKKELNMKYETLFTLTNGYMSTRGSLEEGAEKEQPGNYIAGIFDKSKAQVREIVNTQKWIGLKIFVNGSPLDIDTCNICKFERILDMGKGILTRSLIIRDKNGQETLIEGYRFISRYNVHRAGIKFWVTPLNYDGQIVIESTIDGAVTNAGDFPGIKIEHLFTLKNQLLGEIGHYLETITLDDCMHIGIGTALKINGETKNNSSPNSKVIIGHLDGRQCISVEVKNHETITVEKYAVAFSSRETSEDLMESSAETELKEFLKSGLDRELSNHVKIYEKLWKAADISIGGDEHSDKALRFNIFHLMSTCDENGSNVSIGARALHGEGYKGHVFWDTEIFMLPFFTYVNPRAAKALLMYRYNLLDAARENAVMKGYNGAQYPWESADSGKEETPRQIVGLTGKVIDVLTGDMEHHITADVAFAIFEYFRATDDREFMKKYGIEIIVESARFWASRSCYNKVLNRYEILRVIGPDEFHEDIDNNAYTNYFARWNIEKAVEYLKMLEDGGYEEYEEFISKLSITEEEINSWKSIARKIYLPYNEENKIIEQFDGYFQKKDYLIEELDKNHMPTWPKELDISLVYETQLVKQADVVLLLQLLDNEFDEETKKINYSYYEKRTMHKSSLSPATYSIMGLRTGDTSKAYQYFLKTVNVDLMDNQGNTGQGLHAASTGGAWQIAVFGFGGVYVDKNGTLCINPWLPSKWKTLEFKLYWKGNLLKVEVKMDQTKVYILEGPSNHLNLKIKNEIIKIEI
jgi:kojibiose phosphorylase